MHDIPLDLLKTFITFVESVNIDQASQKLGLSQPAVSVQLKRLEGTLPHPLFSFQGKKKVLSHYGRAIYEAIKVDLSEIQKSIGKVNLQYSNSEDILLRIGARKEIFYWLVERINFNSKIQLIDFSTDVSIEKLLNHDIDVAINHKRPDVASIISRPFFDVTAKFMVHKKYLKSKKPTLDLFQDKEFLTNTPCLAYRENPPFLIPWLQYSGVSIDEVPIRIICEDWVVVIKLIEMGHGYCVMPRNFESTDPDVVSVDIPTEVIPPLKFYILYHQDLKKVQALKDLIKA
jgi:DNA-binding transcriptional LysR family regulator